VLSHEINDAIDAFDEAFELLKNEVGNKDQQDQDAVEDTSSVEVSVVVENVMYGVQLDS
jgi:hypothetical protein